MTPGVATAGDTGARLRAAARGRDRRFWLVVSGIVVAIAGAMLGVAFGSVSVPLGDTITIVADKVLGTHLSTADPSTAAIV